MNEIANYLLLLYFIRKTLVTKASVYGIVGSIFIIFVTIFSDKIKSTLLWVVIFVFLSAYVIIFLTKRSEKRENKKKQKDKLIIYYEDQEEDEIARINRRFYGQTLIERDYCSDLRFSEVPSLNLKEFSKLGDS